MHVDWRTRGQLMPDVLAAGGLTPLVLLRRVTAGIPAKIALKLEHLGPSGSMEDRILRPMILEARRSGLLRSDMRLLSTAAGKSSVALAMAGAALGVGVTIVTPPGIHTYRLQEIEAFGGQILVAPGLGNDPEGLREYARRLADRSPDVYYWVDPIADAWHAEAHYRTTGPEIWEQSEGEVGLLVAGVGSSLTGIARYLKEEKRALSVLGVEPEGNREFAGGTVFPDTDLLDGVVEVSSLEAASMARRLAREEGILAGVATGANVVAAMKAAHLCPSGELVVTLSVDNGYPYPDPSLADAWSDAFEGHPAGIGVPEVPLVIR